MKKFLALLLCCLLLAGCGAKPAETTTPDTTEAQPTDTTAADPFESRFDSETTIRLSDTEITWDIAQGQDETAVRVDRDIIYYADMEVYESGNPYGEGEAHERHTAGEAAAHQVVRITQPGAYRVTGRLSAGQICVDLGEDAYEDPEAVVELILDGADITCTVAPAVLFLNVYECDGDWSTDTAKPEVDTTAAGANLVIEGENTVNGSHVAKIFKDQEEEKKLWKQDGAIYSYMSMNVEGTGSLDLTADNEGLDTELHLTVSGGNINIRSDNDGINTNEDGVSVTTINGGNIHIIAGLGAEGDGIDSNGYLVINGGTVVASANPGADAGMDSDLGSYVNGGTVIALGSTMDWAESDSQQVTMNLQFAAYQSSGSAVVITKEDGTFVFAYDPSEDEVLGENVRQYMGAVISCPAFTTGEAYHVWLDGTVTGTEVGGVYDASTITAYSGGVQQMYTGTDVGMGFGGMGGFGGGQRPDMGEMPEWGEGEMPTMPEGEMPTMPEGEMPTMPELPEGETVPEGFGGGQRPDKGENPGWGGGEPPELPEGETMPEGFQGQTPPGGFEGGRPEGFGGMGGSTEGNTLFYMNDKVNAFSGVTAAAESAEEA